MNTFSENIMKLWAKELFGQITINNPAIDNMFRKAHTKRITDFLETLKGKTSEQLLEQMIQLHEDNENMKIKVRAYSHSVEKFKKIKEIICPEEDNGPREDEC